MSKSNASRISRGARAISESSCKVTFEAKEFSRGASAAPPYQEAIELVIEKVNNRVIDGRIISVPKARFPKPSPNEL
ncbi:hypothetical protein V6N11_064837 [Hibiscus sabdariffa]|uniref:Uncharacterized protein n=1 Tax=Hibiscus sabdariffa TaxID=183260 RepID=A0ABR2SI56_9ROSI